MNQPEDRGQRTEGGDKTLRTLVTLATLRTLERTTWSALQKFNARVKANPGVEILVRHQKELAAMWGAYREEIKARERKDAAKEEVVFTTFIPAPEIGLGCVREVRRSKNFKLTGFWWSGRAPVELDAERQPFYSDPMKHFAAIQRGAVLA